MARAWPPRLPALTFWLPLELDARGRGCWATHDPCHPCHQLFLACCPGNVQFRAGHQARRAAAWAEQLPRVVPRNQLPTTPGARSRKPFASLLRA
jgi:hypothetical protein